MRALQVDFGCKLGAKRTQFAPSFIKIPTPKHPISLLECVAGTTGLEPATSAVTAKRKVVTYRKQASRMASFGAVRNDREPLSNPYQTHDLCPLDLCPNSDLGLNECVGVKSSKVTSFVAFMRRR